jgi:hypothetical protein
MCAGRERGWEIACSPSRVLYRVVPRGERASSRTLTRGGSSALIRGATSASRRPQGVIAHRRSRGRDGERVLGRAHRVYFHTDRSREGSGETSARPSSESHHGWPSNDRHVLIPPQTHIRSTDERVASRSWRGDMGCGTTTAAAREPRRKTLGAMRRSEQPALAQVDLQEDVLDRGQHDCMRCVSVMPNIMTSSTHT